VETTNYCAGDGTSPDQFPNDDVLSGVVDLGHWLRFAELWNQEDLLLARQGRPIKRILRHVGIAYLRVPAIHVDYVRPVAKLSKLRIPFIRIASVKVEVYRRSH
jgi:hypothetical protein